MKVRIYTEDANIVLYQGEVDMVSDRNGCICYVSPWPKKWETDPLEPSLNIKVKDGTTAKVFPDDTGHDDPYVSLKAPAIEDSPIIQNMTDFWKHQAAQSEVS